MTKLSDIKLVMEFANDKRMIKFAPDVDTLPIEEQVLRINEALEICGTLIKMAIGAPQ